MRQKSRTPHGQNAGFRDQEKRKVRAEHIQPKDTHSARNFKPFDTKAYCRSVDQAIRDAVLMLSGWPASIRYSYFVGSNGRLLVRGERRGAK